MQWSLCTALDALSSQNPQIHVVRVAAISNPKRHMRRSGGEARRQFWRLRAARVVSEHLGRIQRDLRACSEPSEGGIVASRLFHRLLAARSNRKGGGGGGAPGNFGRRNFGWIVTWRWRAVHGGGEISYHSVPIHVSELEK